MLVKIKKTHPDAKIPAYAKSGDVGLDLVAISKEFDEKSGCLIFGTGVAFEIPEGFAGLVMPRSSIFKTPLMLANGIGLIDSGYRNEIKVIFRPIDRARNNYEIGDRIAQILILPYPKIELKETDELSETERGDGGFGSTGR